MMMNIFKAIVILIAWGLGYFVINIVVQMISTIFPIQDASTAVALMFIWTIFPAVKFFSIVRDMWQQRGVVSR